MVLHGFADPAKDRVALLLFSVRWDPQAKPHGSMTHSRGIGRLAGSWLPFLKRRPYKLFVATSCDPSRGLQRRQ